MDYRKLTYKINIVNGHSNKKTLEMPILSSDEAIKNNITKALNNINYIPRFIRLYKKDSIFYYKILIDEIFSDIQENLNESVNLLQINSVLFKTIYKKYKELYKDIEELDMLYIIQVLLNYFIPQFFPINGDKIQINSYSSELNNIYRYKNRDYTLTKKDLEDLLIINDNKIEYSLLFSKLVYYDKEIKTTINYKEIFNNFKLDQEIPYISYKSDSFPYIKYYNKIPIELIKNFIYNNKGSITNPYLFVFKALNRTGTDYNTITISENSKIKVNNSWTRQEYVHWENIYDYIDNINEFIKRVNNYNSSTIPLIKQNNMDNIKIKSTLIYFSILKKTSKSKISSMINKNFSDVFKYDSVSNIITNKEDNTSIKIRNGDVVHKNIIYKGTSFNITNVSEKDSLYRLLKNLIYLFHSITKNEEYIIEDVKIKKKVQVLKDIGLDNSISCQKERQVTLDSINPPLKGSYYINHSSSRFICQNKDYPYPGFTSQNTICCFKKDQRDKEIYKKNTSINIKNEIEENTSVTKLLKNKIITLNKILLKNRIGLIFPLFLREQTFMKDFYRIGINQDNYSFITSIEFLFNKQIPVSDLLRFCNTKNIYRSINDGEIYRTKSFETYSYELLKPKSILSHTLLLDLISFYIKKNIIVIDVDNNSIYCRNYPLKIQEIRYKKQNTYYISYNMGHYEPIIQIQERLNSITKEFENSKMNEIYKESCIEPTTIKNKMYGYELIDKLKEEKVIGQVVNLSNRVDYIIFDVGIFPVISSGPLVGIKILNSENIEQYLLDSKTQLSSLKSIKNIVGEVKQQLIWNGIVQGFLVENIGEIPIKNTKNIKKDIPIKEKKMYNINKINNMLFNKKKNHYVERSPSEIYNILLDNSKYGISFYLHNNKIILKTLIDTIESRLLNKQDKLNIVTNIIHDALHSISTSTDNASNKLYIPEESFDKILNSVVVLWFNKPEEMNKYYKKEHKSVLKNKIVIRKDETVITSKEQLRENKLFY